MLVQVVHRHNAEHTQIIYMGEGSVIHSSGHLSRALVGIDGCVRMMMMVIVGLLLQVDLIHDSIQ